MSWHQHAPEPDEAAVEPREEYIEHYEVPPGSGTASSFASRHNEFAPTLGHDGAAHDPKTGAPVHGDGTPNEEPPEHWRRSADESAEGEQPLEPGEVES